MVISTLLKLERNIKADIPKDRIKVVGQNVREDRVKDNEYIIFNFRISNS